MIMQTKIPTKWKFTKKILGFHSELKCSNNPFLFSIVILLAQISKQLEKTAVPKVAGALKNMRQMIGEVSDDKIDLSDLHVSVDVLSDFIIRRYPN
jgi:hypothetical protein